VVAGASLAALNVEIAIRTLCHHLLPSGRDCTFSAYPHGSFAQHILAAFHRGLKEIGYFEGVSDFAAVCPRQLAVQSASAVRQPFGTA
jgi:hypothetical protein